MGFGALRDDIGTCMHWWSRFNYVLGEMFLLGSVELLTDGRHHTVGR